MSIPKAFESERSARSAPVPAPRSRRVLLIEDSPDIAETLQEILEDEGHKIAVAHTGPDGVAAALLERPEVILCDLGLPGMSGYQVAEALRQNPATAGTTLIAVSGYGQLEDVRRSREAGFDDHLTKPISLEQLQAVLSR